jgi:hypothetical protein
MYSFGFMAHFEKLGSRVGVFSLAAEKSLKIK